MREVKERGVGMARKGEGGGGWRGMVRSEGRKVLTRLHNTSLTLSIPPPPPQTQS